MHVNSEEERSCGKLIFLIHSNFVGYLVPEDLMKIDIEVCIVLNVVHEIPSAVR
jgi:hypothetical protein